MDYLQKIVLILILIPSVSFAEGINRCVDSSGKISFSDKLCEAGEKQTEVTMLASDTKKIKLNDKLTKKLDGIFGIKLGQLMPKHWRVQRAGNSLRVVDAPLNIKPPFAGAEFTIDPVTSRVCKIWTYIEDKSPSELRRKRSELLNKFRKEFGSYVFTPERKAGLKNLDKKRLSASDESDNTAHIIVDYLAYDRSGYYSFGISFIDEKACAKPSSLSNPFGVTGGLVVPAPRHDRRYPRAPLQIQGRKQSWQGKNNESTELALPKTTVDSE